jgi:hypothetical protein
MKLKLKMMTNISSPPPLISVQQLERDIDVNK